MPHCFDPFPWLSQNFQRISSQDFFVCKIGMTVYKAPCKKTTAQHRETTMGTSSHCGKCRKNIPGRLAIVQGYLQTTPDTGVRSALTQLTAALRTWALYLAFPAGWCR